MTGPAPTTPPGAPHGDLGEVESRMRRLLGLDGLVPLGWDGNIVPVLLVGDGTLPGMSQTRLRYWTSSAQAGGVGTGYWFKATEDLIIDAIEFATAGGTFTTRYLGPLEADPVAIAIADAHLVDRAQTSNELAPLLRSAVVAGAGGALIFQSVVNLPAGLWRFPERPFLLAKDAKFHVQSGAACSIQVRGRLF